MPCLKFLSMTLGSKTNSANSVFLILHPFLSNYCSLSSFFTSFSHRIPGNIDRFEVVEREGSKVLCQVLSGVVSPRISTENWERKATWMWVHFGRDCQLWECRDQNRLVGWFKWN